MHIAGRKWQKREKMERIISVATFRVCLPASPCVCTYEGFSSHETKASRVIEPEEGGRKKKCDGTYYLRSYFRFLTYSMLLKSSLQQLHAGPLSIEPWLQETTVRTRPYFPGEKGLRRTQKLGTFELET